MPVSTRIRKGHEVSRKQGRPRAVVINAGLAGLSQAVELLEAGCDVCVVSDSLVDSISNEDGLDVLFRPSFSSQNADHLRYFKQSFQKMLSLKAQFPDCGIRLIAGYEFHSDLPPIPEWSKVVFGFRYADPAEIKAILPHASYGFAYTTLVVDYTKYIPFLMQRIKNLGGTLERKQLSSIMDAAMVFVQNRDTLTTSHRPDFVVDCFGFDSPPQPRTAGRRRRVVRLIRTAGSDAGLFALDMTEPDAPVCVVPEDGAQALASLPLTQGPGGPGAAGRLGRLQSLPSLAGAQVAAEWEATEPGPARVRVGLAGAGPAPFQPGSQGGLSPTLLPVLENHGHGSLALPLHWGCAAQVVSLATSAGMLMSVCKL